MPQVAAFPKAYMDPLCVTGEMSLGEWIDLAATLNIDGLEFYSGILDLQDPARWSEARRRAEDCGLAVPMLCCSASHTSPIPPVPMRLLTLKLPIVSPITCDDGTTRAAPLRLVRCSTLLG